MRLKPCLGIIFMGNCLTVEDPQPACRKQSVEVDRLVASSPTKPKKLIVSDISNANAISVPATPKDVEDFRQNAGYNNVDIFTYNEMKLTTKNFRPDQILGEGGFGIVYKGVIDENVRPGCKSTLVAVKVLDPEGFQGDREWLAEVNYLGQLSHPNLVKLIGYCCEDEHRLLVYEYMACGSLEKHLFRRVCLTMPWSTRMKIALGAAKGLAFLHGAERPIIYRDFKTSNILLDSDYNAKLSDFGLAKDGPMGDQTHVSTRVVGTYGYAAPEYVMTGHLTARSDVYGFGVVLLEMLIGRRAMDKSRPSREHNLVEWARPLLNHNRKLMRILDPRMEGQYSAKAAQKVAHLAYQCLSQNPKGRPTMNQVVEILETFQEEAMLQSGGSSVTLYEVPKTPTDKPVDGKKQTGKNGCEGEDDTQHTAKPAKPANGCEGDDAQCRAKPPNGRSKSETAIESDLYSPSSPDFEPQQRKSCSTINGGGKPPGDEADLYNF